MQILFSGVSGYKTLQKLVVFLYSNKEISGKEIKKTVLFTILSNLGISLPKEVKDLTQKTTRH